VEERQRARQPRAQERHPLVGTPPRLRPVVECPAGPVERQRDDDVAHALARTLVLMRSGEVLSRKTTGSRVHALLVVRMYELDAVTMREPMVGGIQIAAVILLDLAALVVHHRVDAVLVRQREIEQLELDRNMMNPSVGVD